MISAALLIIHGLASIVLIGAITHQAIMVWPAKHAEQPQAFFTRLRSLPQPSIYANTVVILYAANFFLGAFLYTSYRVDVRPYLEDTGLFLAAGAFETKEHIAVLGLGLLPAYWLFWKEPSRAGSVTARSYITLLLAFFVWWNFIIGHVLNNIRGLGL